MLYKIQKNGADQTRLIPQPFRGLALEKDLENILAANLWQMLEGNKMLPIFQERCWQPEADIYALKENGDLVIFELKRDHAGEGAVHQALRYCEKASRLQYHDLQRMYSHYTGNPEVDLQEEHQAMFDLEHKLDQTSFNRQQHLMVVGSAGDENLARNVNYWKSKGLTMDFVPYRVYEIGGETYFEFFSLPYDVHANPAHAKGVIFDTNLSYDANSIWYMCENRRVAAFGDQMGVIYSLGKNDIVFLYHKNHGIIAAGKVVSTKVSEDAPEEALYHTLEWLTAVPKRGEPIRAMPAWQIKKSLGYGFFWARTIKVPYLSISDSETLLKELIKVIGARV